MKSQGKAAGRENDGKTTGKRQENSRKQGISKKMTAENDRK
jgi:hypothetical protein